MTDDRDMLLGDDSFDGDNPFGDDFGADEEGFEWDGEGGEPFDDDLGEFDLDLGDEDADAPDFGKGPAVEGDERPTIFGLNRTFVLIAAIIALVLCVGVVAVLVVVSNRGPSDIQLTVTSVYATNTYVAYALDLTETQNAVNAGLTATADAWTDTPTPTPTHTPSPTPMPTTEAPTQVQIFVTPTGEAVGLDASAIELTATALAEILRGGTPTPEEGVPVANGNGGFVTPTPISTALPSTGLFDEGFGNGGGVNGLLTAGLAALGLAAIIVISRRLRVQG